jgi:hypothetical protein
MGYEPVRRHTRRTRSSDGSDDGEGRRGVGGGATEAGPVADVPAHFTLGVRLLATYLGVSALHALWYAMHGIALRLTLLLTEGEAYRPSANGWLVEPSAAQVRLLPVLEWGGLALVSAVGITWLLLEWRAGRRRQPPPAGFRVRTGGPGSPLPVGPPPRF